MSRNYYEELQEQKKRQTKEGEQAHKGESRFAAAMMFFHSLNPFFWILGVISLIAAGLTDKKYFAWGCLLPILFLVGLFVLMYG